MKAWGLLLFFTSLPRDGSCLHTQREKMLDAEDFEALLAHVKNNTLTTEWGDRLLQDSSVIPLTEYPRPGLRRSDGTWSMLNGWWDAVVTAPLENESVLSGQMWKRSRKIRVPFCIESKLSGWQEPLPTKDSFLWYRRRFTLPEAAYESTPISLRTFINFEAIDNAATVWVNGMFVGHHVGGFTPFRVEVTSALLSSKSQEDHEVVVKVSDPTDGAIPRGKQSRHPVGIWYSPVSGIWQSVWVEVVPQTHFASIKLGSFQSPDSSWFVSFSPVIFWGRNSACSCSVRILPMGGGGNSVAEASYLISNSGEPPENLTIQIPSPHLWSLKSAYLYEVIVTLQVDHGDEIRSIDSIESYTALRKVGRSLDAQGHLRFTLNGKDVFHLGTLDQGWWPDGLLTPPSDQAQLSDLLFLRASGFNTVRKHAKVENRRYYFHCDRLGLMVWQDHVSADQPNNHHSEKLSPKWSRLGNNSAATWISNGTSKGGYWSGNQPPEEGVWSHGQQAQFLSELEEMCITLESHPSIVVWVPFNEAWGQHQTLDVGKWLVARDPSRLVNVASGGNFWPVGDIVDHHSYPLPYFPAQISKDRRRKVMREYPGFVKVVGEFGGHGLAVNGHTFNANGKRSWGYGELKESSELLQSQYLRSMGKLGILIRHGISAGIYTQTSDVEGEVNGLLTYDRRVFKLNSSELSKIHSHWIFSVFSKAVTRFDRTDVTERQHSYSIHSSVRTLSSSSEAKHRRSMRNSGRRSSGGQARRDHEYMSYAHRSTLAEHHSIDSTEFTA